MTPVDAVHGDGGSPGSCSLDCSAKVLKITIK